MSTSTRASAVSRPWPSRCGRRPACPLDALDDDDDLDGLVVRDGGRAVLTVRGRLLANLVTGRLRTDGDLRPPGTMPTMRDPEPVLAAPGNTPADGAHPATGAHR